ncbi:hypothetical protein ABQF35_22740 [Mycobacterium syngnathidarum]
MPAVATIAVLTGITTGPTGPTIRTRRGCGETVPTIPTVATADAGHADIAVGTSRGTGAAGTRRAADTIAAAGATIPTIETCRVTVSAITTPPRDTAITTITTAATGTGVAHRAEQQTTVTTNPTAAAITAGTTGTTGPTVLAITTRSARGRAEHPVTTSTASAAEPAGTTGAAGTEKQPTPATGPTIATGAAGPTVLAGLARIDPIDTIHPGDTVTTGTAVTTGAEEHPAGTPITTGHAGYSITAVTPIAEQPGIPTVLPRCPVGTVAEQEPAVVLITKDTRTTEQRRIRTRISFPITNQIPPKQHIERQIDHIEERIIRANPARLALGEPADHRRNRQHARQITITIRDQRRGITRTPHHHTRPRQRHCRTVEPAPGLTAHPPQQRPRQRRIHRNPRPIRRQERPQPQHCRHQPRHHTRRCSRHLRLRFTRERLNRRHHGRNHLCPR